jgi:stage II sporulation protein D
VEQESQESAEVYKVQVASLKKREPAEALAEKLDEAFSLPVTVRENTESGTHQVRIGAFRTREEARSFASGRLARAGYRDTIIVREEAPAESGKLRLALRGKDLLRVSSAGFLLLPGRDASFLQIDGKAYRGQMDIILNRNGLITVVNQLGVEEYLLGVIPAEMSPSTYPEAAALAAQSVAARTYALKNSGRFAAEGFDLTADTRSQVYGGAAQEREASSDAVRATAGIAIYYQGSLIDAMYASTCGGRTEDFANVFDAAPVPYLRGVVCLPESTKTGIPERGIEGKHDLDETVFADDGSVANRHLELAQVLGIIGPEPISLQELSEPSSRDEIRKWVNRAASLGGGGTEQGVREDSDIESRGGFIRYAAERLFGVAEIERRVSAKDVDYFLANLKDGGAVPAPARRAFAYVMQAGLWRPYPDNSVRPLEGIRRGDALTHLLAMIERIHPEILRSGVFDSAGLSRPGEDSGSSISVKWGNRTQRFALAGNLRLFKIAGNRSTPASSLKLIGNEKIRFHLGQENRIDFLEVELNPAGASSDRYSPVALWQVTIPRSVVAEKLRALAGNIGELRDLKPAKLGVSGRAVKIEVSGSRNTVVLNGYRVRNALGLKDTLFTIHRVYDPAGLVESFTFNGRGWGHGVGLCQVGAYGMARSGSRYEEILKTYYQGVELRKAY